MKRNVTPTIKCIKILLCVLLCTFSVCSGQYQYVIPVPMMVPQYAPVFAPFIVPACIGYMCATAPQYAQPPSPYPTYQWVGHIASYSIVFQNGALYSGFASQAAARQYADLFFYGSAYTITESTSPSSVVAPPPPYMSSPNQLDERTRITQDIADAYWRQLDAIRRGDADARRQADQDLDRLHEYNRQQHEKWRKEREQQQGKE